MQSAQDQGTISALRGLDWFADLSDKNLIWLSELSKRVELEPGEELFAYGSQQASIYEILEGLVVVFRNRKIINQLTAVHYFDEVALVDETTRSASARAGPATTVLELPVD